MCDTFPSAISMFASPVSLATDVAAENVVASASTRQRIMSMGNGNAAAVAANKHVVVDMVEPARSSTDLLIEQLEKELNWLRSRQTTGMRDMHDQASELSNLRVSYVDLVAEREELKQELREARGNLYTQSVALKLECNARKTSAGSVSTVDVIGELQKDLEQTLAVKQALEKKIVIVEDYLKQKIDTLQESEARAVTLQNKCEQELAHIKQQYDWNLQEKSTLMAELDNASTRLKSAERKIQLQADTLRAATQDAEDSVAMLDNDVCMARFSLRRSEDERAELEERLNAAETMLAEKAEAEESLLQMRDQLEYVLFCWNTVTIHARAAAA